MPSTKLVLTTGDQVEVDGSTEDVAKVLQDAVRSSPGTLAWLTATDTEESFALNPAHVVTLRAGDG